DEAVSEPTTFSTFSGLEFFGSPVTGLIASSNGWLTFDTAYAGTADGTPDPMGTATGPNAVVAPLWHDLVADVCVLEEADQLTVEWNGGWWLADLVGAGFVQMQVVIAASGTIELIYGPDHDLAREEPVAA